MNAEQLEQLVQQTLGKIRTFVLSFVSAREEKIESRLDALVLEKAKEEGISLTLKKPFNWLNLIGLTFGSAAFIAGVYLVIFFVPGPWVRFIAKPQVVTMQLSNVDFSFNGVAADKRSIDIISPKSIKGEQFVVANLSVSPEIAMDVTLEDNNTKIVITPREALSEGVTYTVSLKSGVLFADGTYLANDQAWVVPTKAAFDVISISPRDGAVAAKNVAFEVSFSTDEFDLEVAKSKISVYPKIEGLYLKVGSRVVFTPKKGLQQGGVYTVIVAADMKNLQDKAISKEYRSTFTISNDVEATAMAPSVSVSGSPIVNVAGGAYGTLVYGTKISQVKVSYYKVSWQDMQPYVNEYIRKGTLNPEPVISEMTPSSTKTINNASSGDYGMFTVPYETLGDGVYVVKIAASNNDQLRTYLLAFKSTIGVYATARQQSSHADVWAFDYTTLNPSKDVTITAANCTSEGCSTVSEVTPENGNVQVKADRKISYLYAEKAGSVAILYPGQRYNTFNLADEARTDRTIFAKVIPNKPNYYPNDRYEYSVLLRKHVNGKFEKLAKNTTFIAALCPDNQNGFEGFILDENSITGKCLSVKEFQSNGDSQLIGSVQLWQRSESLRLVIAQKTDKGINIVAEQYIEISEVDRKQAQVMLSFNKERYVGNESVTLAGRLTNVAGAGISNKKGTVTIRFDAVKAQSSTSSVAPITRQITTDSSGNYKITTELPVAMAQQYAYEMIAGIEFRDGENLIAATDYANWDHGEILTTSIAGNNKYGEVVSVGNNAIIQLKLADGSTNQPVAGRKVTLVVTRKYQVAVLGEFYYDEETRTTKQQTTYETRNEQILKKENAVFSEQGEYSFELTSLKEGSYILQTFDSTGEWLVRDERQILWTTSSNSFDEINRMNEWVYGVSFDKASASVGEKVTITIDSSYKKTKQQIAMVFKSGEVIDWRYISQDTRKIEIPVTQSMVGGLQVCFIHPMKGYTGSADATVFMGFGINSESCAYLLVENKEKELQLQLNPEKLQIQPGKESNLSITVTNAEAKGQESVLGVTVVDKATYLKNDGVLENQKLELYREIYQNFSRYSDVGYSTQNVLDMIDAVGGMGSGGAEKTGVRTDFDENTYWNAQIYTDADGKASINIPYNDAITTWVVTVWAVTDDFKVGSETIEIVATKGVYVDLDKPKVVRVGDVWRPYVRVINTENQSFSGTLELTCDGCLENNVSLPVALPDLSTVDVQVDARVTKSGRLPFTVKLTQNGNLVDGLTYEINARPIGFLDPFSLQTTVSKKQSEIKFTVPDSAISSLGDYTIAVGQLPILLGLSQSPNPSNATTEEIAASLLSLAAIAEHEAYGASLLTQEQVYRDAQFYVAELQYRLLADGSFSALPSGGEDQQSSISAATALATAMRIFGNKLYITNDLKGLLFAYQQKLILADKASLETKSKAAFALALISKEESASLVTALLKVTDLSTATTTQLAYLAQALQEIGATSDAGAVTEKLATNAKESSGALYIPSDDSALTTSMLASLYRKLDFAIVKSAELEKYQWWVMNSCSYCMARINAAMTMRFLTESYAGAQLGSSKQEEYSITLNGKEITKIYYNGQFAQLDLPANEVKAGENILRITSPSGRQVFATLTGNHYKTTTAAVQDPAYKVAINYVGASATRQYVLGAKGFLQVTVTAQEDIANSVVQVYLPTGLTRSLSYESPQLYKLLQEGALFAYGDAAKSDAYQVEINALKKGQSRTIVLPVIALRQGSFNGEVVRILSVNGKGTTIVGGTLQVK